MMQRRRGLSYLRTASLLFGSGLVAVLGAVSLGQAGEIDYTLEHELDLGAAYFLRDSQGTDRNNSWEASALYRAKSKFYIGDESTILASFYTRWARPDYMRGAFVEPSGEQNKSAYADVEELAYLWEGMDYGFKIGKLIQNYEFSDRMTLLNRYNVTDSTNPLMNVKTGNWLVQGLAFFDQGSLKLTVMPYHPKVGSPPEESRWGGVDSRGNLITSDTETGGKEERSNLPDVTLIWESSTENFDYLLGAGVGQSTYSVIEVDTNFLSLDAQTVYPDNRNIFAGITLPIDEVKTYGEIYYQETKDGMDDNFLRAVIGAKFSLFEWGEKLGFTDMRFIAEYLHDHTTHHQDAENFTNPSSKSRPTQDTVYLGLEIDIDSQWSFTQNASYGRKMDEYMVGSSLKYKIDDSQSVEAKAVFFGGQSGKSVYGAWRNNDSIGISYNLKF